ncbi:MAG TPA: CHRD domain-containing protein, partial [Bacteroidia bacterium]|nr:CHRD domain-containing protein [Bacteroidia bacterium]
MKKFCTSILMLFSAVYMYGQVNGKLLVTAKMSGLQEVPVVSSSGTGVAGLFLTPGRDSLFINITVANLSGPITGIHIHEAPKGVNGGVVVDLMPYLKGTHVSTVLTGANINAAFIAKLLAGKLYVNAHTAANPNGEIRGQLELEAEYAFWGTLEGDQEVPPTGSTAMGWVAASLSHDKSMVNVWAVWRGLTGPATSAHFHMAAPGSNGSVVLDLSSQISGNTIVATMPAGAIAGDLLAGNIYLNVHTAAFPNGEIRAQMMQSDKLNFVAWIDAGQETPPTSAVGKGIAFIRVNTTLDSIWYNVLVDSLSGTITGAHFHEGVKGFAGNIIINIGSGVNGNMISGVSTGTAAGVTMANINKMMMGQAYINIHTANNSSGEIRGQVIPMARTGFVVV